MWADLIFVMETGHRGRICGTYRHLQLPKIEILHIADEFEFMDDELVQLLTDRINDTLKTVYKL